MKMHFSNGDVTVTVIRIQDVSQKNADLVRQMGVMQAVSFTVGRHGTLFSSWRCDQSQGAVPQ